MLSAVRIGPHHHHVRFLSARLLLRLRRALDPSRQPAAGDQAGPRTRTFRLGPALETSTLAAPQLHAHIATPAGCFLRGLAMVIHHQPGRLRRNTDQPTAITNVPLATSGSSHCTGDIPLGIPTCSARSRHGLWALYPNGPEVVIVWPGGALAGPPAEVAGELDRLRGDDLGDLDRAAVGAIRQFLTDPDGQDGASWPATTRARTWSSPATGYWLSGPTNQPSHDDMPSSWPGAPARPAHPPIPLPDPTPAPAPAQAA
jgi:hypothetical protein